MRHIPLLRKPPAFDQMVKDLVSARDALELERFQVTKAIAESSYLDSVDCDCVIGVSPSRVGKLGGVGEIARLGSFWHGPDPAATLRAPLSARMRRQAPGAVLLASLRSVTSQKALTAVTQLPALSNEVLAPEGLFSLQHRWVELASLRRTARRGSAC